MAGDPTPMEYDEPIEHVEWGVVVKGTGEAARLLSEEVARITVKDRDDLLLVKRTVVYHPWTTVSTAPPSFTCPTCGRTSHHPRDVEYGYCGACHAFTGEGWPSTGTVSEPGATVGSRPPERRQAQPEENP